jgi:hypothetical protein
MGSNLAGSQIDHAIRCIEEIRVCIPLIGSRGEKAIRASQTLG